LAATTSTTFPLVVSSQRNFRELAEPLFGFACIILVLWLPTREQLAVGPPILLTPLALTLWRGATPETLGLSWRSFLRSLWIIPATITLMTASIYIARSFGTYHPLYQADLRHVGGYILWTLYQQFLLQDYFMPRLSRALSSNAALLATAALFAAAHLPNLWLTVATLVWGIVSCALFRRYRSLYVLGIAQGMLGLCFAVCIPDAIHHHLRVGLGYLHYRG
jgi:membrane protease YdiL (CAAX protease family)